MAEAPLCLGKRDGWYIMEPFFGKSITSIGINWLQNGITFNSASHDLYFSNTSAIVFCSPLFLQRLNLKTCRPSFSASLAKISGFPFTSGIVKTPTISWPFARKFLYTSIPNCDWPMIATRKDAMIFAEVWSDRLELCKIRWADNICRSKCFHWKLEIKQ